MDKGPVTLRQFLFTACALCLLISSPATASNPPWLTGESAPEDLDIFLITFGPGTDIPSWFGHGALGVRDRKLRQALLYNYGMFSFDNAMLAKFATGRLEFWVGDASVQGTLGHYRRE